MTHEDILTVSSAKSADATQEIGSRSRRLYKHGTAGKGDKMEKIKCCPFCGSEVDFMNLVTPIKMFYCKNHRGCGAIVSFDTPLCNRFDKAKIDAWNRREGGQYNGSD